MPHLVLDLQVDLDRVLQQDQPRGDARLEQRVHVREEAVQDLGGCRDGKADAHAETVSRAASSQKLTRPVASRGTVGGVELCVCHPGPSGLVRSFPRSVRTRSARTVCSFDPSIRTFERQVGVLVARELVKDVGKPLRRVQEGELGGVGAKEVHDHVRRRHLALECLQRHTRATTTPTAAATEAERRVQISWKGNGAARLTPEPAPAP